MQQNLVQQDERGDGMQELQKEICLDDLKSGNHIAPVLCLNALSYSIRSRKLFEDINLSLYPGDILLLSGKNHRSKTEFFNLLAAKAFGFTGTIAVGNLELSPKRSRDYFGQICSFPHKKTHLHQHGFLPMRHFLQN